MAKKLFFFGGGGGGKIVFFYRVCTFTKHIDGHKQIRLE